MQSTGCHLYSFEKLRVWQDARHLIRQVYDVSRKFPQHEIFGLTSQINRAVVSVAANLAEGCSRTSLKDQAHFSQLAYSSLTELACELLIAQDLGYFDGEVGNPLRAKIEQISAQINALRLSQLNR